MKDIQGVTHSPVFGIYWFRVQGGKAVQSHASISEAASVGQMREKYLSVSSKYLSLFADEGA